MYFAYALPWWSALLLLALSAVIGYLSYFRARGPVRTAATRDVQGVGVEHGAGGRGRPVTRRTLLAALRSAALLVLLLVLFRPMLVIGHRNPRSPIVPILVDQSRSMRIADADGERRIDRAATALRSLTARLETSFQPQVLGFGGVVAPVDTRRLAAAAEPASDIEGALRAVERRYRGQNIAGIILLSDGAETAPPDAAAAGEVERPVATAGRAPVPVFAVGIGSVTSDREVANVTAGRDVLAGSLVDLDAVVSSRGFGAAPFDVRLTARAPESAGEARVVDVRRVNPQGDGPVQVRFQVTPEAAPTVYTVEVPAEPGEAVVENNRGSAIVAPAVRRRRILFVEGAPGFEHAFMKRAWAGDPALEVDSVVRKGTNDQGRNAYLIQADPARSAALIGGFPTTRAGLFVYDAVVLGSIEWDALTREQLDMVADFVSQRGGGLLVLGARSFASPGLAGSALDAALPLARTAGNAAVTLTANTIETNAQPAARAGDNKLRLTMVGRDHEMMRVSGTPDESERLWGQLPPLATTTRAGAARPGASVLAVTNVNGATLPLLAVQRFGRGRTAEFTGEGSWRWKMLMPASDRTHERFWRQAARWLSAAAPDPVSIVPTQAAQPGQPLQLDVLTANGEFEPSSNATVTLRVTAPDGAVQTATAAIADGTTGRYTARLRPPVAGVYHVQADARAGNQVLGSAEEWFVAGAEDPELADPRLNDAVLRRIAAATGGRYLPVGTVAEVPGLITVKNSAAVTAAEPRDLWQHPLVFALIAVLLGTEWVLRRRWGFA